MSPPVPARLLSIATATPRHVIEQDQAAEAAVERFGGKVFRADDIRTLFANTGIRKRKSVRPQDWYLTPRPWEERNAVYLEEAEALWLEVAAKALDLAGLNPDEVDAVVTVSSTGIATPSLEARVGAKLGLEPTVMRTPVFGLGCGGGVSGLSLASRLAQARPGSSVLLVVVELCTLSVRPEEATKANVVATALFGDGAAACVLCAGEGHEVSVGPLGEHTWPDTLDIMGWRVDPAGLGVVLDANLPGFVQKRFAEAAASFDAGGPIDRYVCHPGGAKVLPAIEHALGLGEGALHLERQVLAAFGNMSAPTVFFVLERALQQTLDRRLCLAALGPGFTASFAVLEPAVAY